MMSTKPCSVIATLLLASTALITSAAAAPPQRGGGGGGGAPHPVAAAPHVAAPAPHFAAPAPHVAAPAPHFAAPAPHMAVPHFSAPVAHSAPHFAAPHVAAPHMAGPRMATPHGANPHFTPHFAHRGPPSHGNAPRSFTAHGAHAPNVARHAITPHTNGVGNAANRLHDGNHDRNGRNAIGNAANGVRDRNGRNAVNNAADGLRERNGRSTVGVAGQGRATTNGSAVTSTNRNGVGGNRILRNSALANVASRNSNARNLANSTFRGRFAGSAFGRDWDRRHHHNHHFGFVLGFVGPLFWPYAYDDFVDYTFWPDAYDTFWPYAYDDVFQGIYGAYAPEYGAAYAYAGAPASSTVYRRGSSAAGGGGAAQVCSDQAQGLTDFPIDQIARQVNPDRKQQGLLDDLKAATAKAVGILQAACPNDLPSTPTGRLAAMHQRVQAMLQAVETVRPALARFYDALSDEQKERFNALDQNAFGNAPQPDVAQLCGNKRSSPASLPMAEIQQSLQLSRGQESDLRALDEASAKSSDILGASCPTDRALTPPGRVAAMEQRLKGMLQAIETVRPALNKFYGSLSDEQKARFDRLGRKRT